MATSFSFIISITRRQREEKEEEEDEDEDEEEASILHDSALKQHSISTNPGPTQIQSQLCVNISHSVMDNSGKEKEAMQLMAEADKKVKSSGSFLGGMFG